MTPVMTLTDGLWVAITRWIPAALASWARRQMESSTSLDATIIRSASSSMMITSWGSFAGIWSAGTSPASIRLFTLALYPFKSLTLLWANFWYRSIISATAQFKAPAAFLGSVTTGIRRCGIPL